MEHPAAGRGSGMGLIGRWPELPLSILVVGVVAMMILPLPTWLLDLLITSNLLVSVLLLLTAIYVREPLGFATFPALLLFTTLYRLGLNVSATRLILLQADAGRVIDAFGRFVVAGDYIVGAIVFFIITLIQFVVIARGSQRVAEVAARFALDAMPGKQLAIDGDLRAGLIGRDEARRRRQRLDREGQLYGAMDGAMKFVMGDAIASLVIVAVNIVAGTAIGVLRHGLALPQALEVYGVLTIGDGLVSQIPALIISTSAGLIVTRVASEDAEGRLGRDIQGQVLSQPRTLALASGLLVVLSLIPGLPFFPFFTLGAVAAVSAYGLQRARRTGASGTLLSGAALPEDRRPVLAVEAGSSLHERLKQHPLGLAGAVREAMKEAFARTGAPYPQPEIRTDGDDLAADRFRVMMGDLRIAEGGIPAAMSNDDGVALLREAVSRGLRERAPLFLGMEETRDLLDALEKEAPHLVHAVLSRPESGKRVCMVLKELLRDGVNIRDRKGILEAYLEAEDGQASPPLVADKIRALRRSWITVEVSDRDGVLRPIVLSPDMEAALVDGLRPGRSGEELALSKDLTDRLRMRMESLSDSPAPLVLTKPLLRRPLKDLLSSWRPSVRVVSFDELDPGLRISASGVIDIE